MKVSYEKELDDSEAAALTWAAVSAGFDGSPEEYFAVQAGYLIPSYQGQRMQIRLSVIPQRLAVMPPEPVAEAQKLFQIPDDFPNGKDPLPPYKS